MPKYRVHVTVTRESGTRHPREPEVTWGAERLADPKTHLGGSRIWHSGANDRDGVICGMYDSIKHAESLGETPTLDDIEVTVERVTEVMKRGKVANVRRAPTVNVASSYRDIFEEIMSRPRPLG